jgi:hypothetical protein
MAVILAVVVAGPLVVRRIWRWRWREKNCAKSNGVTQVVAVEPTLEKARMGASSIAETFASSGYGFA